MSGGVEEAVGVTAFEACPLSRAKAHKVSTTTHLITDLRVCAFPIRFKDSLNSRNEAQPSAGKPKYRQALLLV
jgi:hypothetical protein